MFSLVIYVIGACDSNIADSIVQLVPISAGHQYYRKISNLRRTESPNLNVSCLVLQLPLPNPMKPGVQSRMKM